MYPENISYTIKYVTWRCKTDFKMPMYNKHFLIWRKDFWGKYTLRVSMRMSPIKDLKALPKPEVNKDCYCVLWFHIKTKSHNELSEVLWTILKYSFLGIWGVSGFWKQISSGITWLQFALKKLYLSSCSWTVLELI